MLHVLSDYVVPTTLHTYILFYRTCPVCQRTFQSERGLKQHVNSEGSASQCRRHQEIAKKAQIIRTNRERRAEAKKG